jgi:hypothetical protein
MNTVTKTSKAAIARKLNSLGFELRDGWMEVGYQITNHGGHFLIGNKVYVQHPSTMAEELTKAGYAVINTYILKIGYTTEIEFCEVLGRVGA